MMKIGFAGFRHGHIYSLYEQAKNHPSYELVATYEKDAKTIEDASAKGVDISYTDYAEFLKNEDIEVVAIGAAFGDRGRMAIEALKAGKHVICDKPLCTRLQELCEIERLATERGLSVSCMFTMRYEHKIAGVKALIDSGRLGKIHNVYFGGQHPLMYGRRPDWYFDGESHGGVINDIAIHGIDLLSYLCGLSVEKINAARCWNAYATEEKHFKDSAQLMLTATNGAGILSDVSYAIPDGAGFGFPDYWRFYIWGEGGVISFSMNTDAVFFEKGKTAGEIIENGTVTDYLSDFALLVEGKANVLPMKDVFSATRCTLEIQKEADLADQK
jgi:predicted dehydrogenase